MHTYRLCSTLRLPPCRPASALLWRSPFTAQPQSACSLNGKCEESPPEGGSKKRSSCRGQVKGSSAGRLWSSFAPLVHLSVKSSAELLSFFLWRKTIRKDRNGDVFSFKVCSPGVLLLCSSVCQAESPPPLSSSSLWLVHPRQRKMEGESRRIGAEKGETKGRGLLPSTCAVL